MYIIFREPLELESSTILFLNALDRKLAKHLIKTVQKRKFDKEKALKENNETIFNRFYNPNK